jgi:hypothetical protein
MSKYLTKEEVEKKFNEKFAKIDVNECAYDENDNIVRIPHKISEEDISKLTIVKWDCMFGGHNYSVLLEERPNEYEVIENRSTEERCIWEYFYLKLNFPERKVSFNIKKL